MAIIDAVRAGIKVADKVLRAGKMEALVTLQHYVSSNAFGDKTYTTTADMRAVVDWKQKQVRTMQGVLSVSRASVMFLNVTELLAATNGDGLNDEDLILLPNEVAASAILDMSGFIDGGTGRPVATEAWLG